ncbi:MAG: hypothetical protein AAFR26_25660 [Cyanobacteria bacterium J06626_4]
MSAIAVRYHLPNRDRLRRSLNSELQGIAGKYGLTRFPTIPPLLAIQPLL